MDMGRRRRIPGVPQKRATAYRRPRPASPADFFPNGKDPGAHGPGPLPPLHPMPQNLSEGEDSKGMRRDDRTHPSGTVRSLRARLSSTGNFWRKRGAISGPRPTWGRSAPAALRWRPEAEMRHPGRGAGPGGPDPAGGRVVNLSRRKQTRGSRVMKNALTGSAGWRRGAA